MALQLREDYKPASGEQELIIDPLNNSATAWQIAFQPRAEGGTVTVLLRFLGLDDYQGFEGNAIDLSAPKQLFHAGILSGIKLMPDGDFEYKCSIVGVH